MHQSLYAAGHHANPVTPMIIPRAEHPISRRLIDEEALKVLYRLHRHGFLAYLVGGSVRDLLLGRAPKDFDVVTNARPPEINTLFRNSRTIGRRFRLVHVFFRGRKIVEVSTFRSQSEFEEIQTEEGDIIRTESFGTAAEDAFRRDITINGLFYNIADFSIIDFVGGMDDLQRKVIRSIGDPDEKFQQDPVRMIRVIRHAARTGFRIDEQTYQAILRHRERIQTCSPSRVRDEFFRDLKEGATKSFLSLMIDTGLLFTLFPDLFRVFGDRNPFRNRDKQFFLSLFGHVDQRIKMNATISDSVLVALLLTPLLRAVSPDHPFLGENQRRLYLLQSIQWTIDQALTPFAVPRGIKETASQILLAQSLLRRSVQRGFIPKKLRLKKYIREAILLFLIEARAKGEKTPPLLQRQLPPAERV